MNSRSLFAEGLGTALLVFFGVGTATLSFGFKVAGASQSAGVVATALAFGLVLLVLVYALGPISGCHVNPAVTIGFLVARRISMGEAVGYWIAQIVGGIVGAGALYGMFQLASDYTKSTGLGANGFGKASTVGLAVGGALIAEAVLSFIFVFVILAVTRRVENATVAGVAIGFALALVHIIGIPLTGTSVNPARSIGPAIFVGGDALTQLWMFIVGPLLGGVIAAIVHRALYPEGEEAAEVAPAPELRP